MKKRKNKNIFDVKLWKNTAIIKILLWLFFFGGNKKMKINFDNEKMGMR